MDYDLFDGPTREQLHAELDRLLDKGRISDEDGEMAQLPKGFIGELHEFFVGVTDGLVGRSTGKQQAVKVSIHDANHGYRPAEWAFVPNEVTDRESCISYIEAAKTISLAAERLQQQASSFLRNPERYEKGLFEREVSEPNATTQAAIDEARDMRKDQN